MKSRRETHTGNVSDQQSGDPRTTENPVVVTALYKFVSLPDYEAIRDQLLTRCETVGMRGSILLATEGINGTVAAPREATDEIFEWLRADERFADLEVKESLSHQLPFRRMKVRLKKEIVTFGKPVDPTTRVGTYVDPTDWNDIISGSDVLVIDTRNLEEVALGSFENAVDPGTESFGEFAEFVDTLDPADHPKVAMFCTGGIRCEKASAYMLDQGFDEVFHLKGGILQYLEDVDPAESMWRGECFVFDERVTVDHDLQPGDYTLCRGCRRVLGDTERSAREYEEGVSCGRCIDDLTQDRAERLRERHRQVLFAEARGGLHLAPHG